MELILWRHADAEPAAPGQADHERELTAKGRRQAAKMAAWLDRHLPANCRILSSPALRCVHTAEALGRKFRCAEALGTASSAEAILELTGWPEASDTLMIVGHQPLLGQVASLILAGQKQDWTLRKGQVLWLARRIKEEPDVYIRAAIGADLAGVK